MDKPGANRHEAIGTVAVHRVEDASALGPNWNSAKYPGLTDCFVILGEDGEKRVVSFWRDHLAYESSKGRFGRRLKAKPGGWAGDVSEVGARAESWWRRISLSAYILGLAALLGAIGTFTNAYYDVLASARFIIRSPEDAPIDVLEGTETKVKLNIENHHTKAPLFFATTNCILSSGQTVPATWPTKVDIAKEAEVICRIPALPAPTNELRAEGEVWSGVFRQHRFTNVFPIRVWSRVSVRLGEVQSVTASNCVCSVRLSVGKAWDDVAISAQLAHQPGVTFFNATPNTSLRENLTNASSGKEMVKLTWYGERIAAFGERTFEVELRSDRVIQAQEWTNITKKVKVYESTYEGTL